VNADEPEPVGVGVVKKSIVNESPDIPMALKVKTVPGLMVTGPVLDPSTVSDGGGSRILMQLAEGEVESYVHIHSDGSRAMPQPTPSSGEYLE
jgi:hypothetical protein